MLMPSRRGRGKSQELRRAHNMKRLSENGVRAGILSLWHPVRLGAAVGLGPRMAGKWDTGVWFVFSEAWPWREGEETVV